MIIAGKVYRHAGETTLLHDLWVVRQLTACGLDDVKMLPEEKPEDFAQRLLLQASNDGRVMTLLGGLVVPVRMTPEEWSPELAAETGRAFAGVTSKEDKVMVRGQIAEALASFFGHGLAALRTSQNSSQAKPEMLQSTEEAQTTAAGQI